MRSISFFIACMALLLSCGSREDRQEFCLNGVWEIEQREYPGGEVEKSTQDGNVWLRIYDDSCFYNCRIVEAPNGTMLIPLYMDHYTLVRTGSAEYLYQQGEDMRPLSVSSDSTMVIQEYGTKYTWKMTSRYDDRTADIIHIIRGDIKDANSTPNRYVFSNAEDKLQSINHTLIYTLIGIVLSLMMVLNYVYRLYRNKKRIEEELSRLEQERSLIPEPVRRAMNSVEEEFHKSDYYLSLRRKISQGARLGRDEWDEMEKKLLSVYPHFTGTLLSLYSMSQVELQVCLLLKLGCSPSEIATVLCKDTSSISSIRSRLYNKVFGRKGGSRDWDEFILSL